MYSIRIDRCHVFDKQTSQTNEIVEMLGSEVVELEHYWVVSTELDQATPEAGEQKKTEICHFVYVI